MCLNLIFIHTHSWTQLLSTRGKHHYLLPTVAFITFKKPIKTLSCVKLCHCYSAGFIPQQSQQTCGVRDRTSDLCKGINEGCKEEAHCQSSCWQTRGNRPHTLWTGSDCHLDGESTCPAAALQSHAWCTEDVWCSRTTLWSRASLATVWLKTDIVSWILSLDMGLKVENINFMSYLKNYSSCSDKTTLYNVYMK